MFTLLAIGLGVGVILFLQRQYHKEKTRNRAFDSADDFNNKTIRESIVFARQDLMYIVGLLGAILLMLGIIADKMH
jgi:hypothetical protein